MLPVLLPSLVLAAGGILSVGSITLVILLLISDRGWRNGLAYALGYIGAYSLIGLGVVLIGYEASDTSPGEPNLVAPALFTILGLLLLYISVRNGRKKPDSQEQPSSPRLFAIIDKATPLKTFGFGMLVSVINFKNLAIFLSAVSVVHLSRLPLEEKIISVLLVTFVFCLSVIVPVLIYLLFPRRAGAALNWIKRTLETHSRAIGIWLPLLFGLLFLFRGLTALL